MDNEFLCVLQGTLNPADHVRNAAETRLNELQQLPGLSLRRYILAHWSPFFDTFEGSAPSADLKSEVRRLLFRGLSDPVRKIRLSCAYATAELAHSDWPDEYPQLMDLLVDLLEGGKPEAVDGALRVLTEFVKADLTEDQLLPTAQKMLPHLLAILKISQLYSAVSRARALAVFRQSVVTLHTVRDQWPEAVNSAMESILPQWLQALSQILSLDATGDVTDEARWGRLAVRIEAFRTLDTVLNGFPKALSSFVPEFLTSSLAHLKSLAILFETIYVIDGEAEAPFLSDEGSDVSVDLQRLASFILDFVVHLAEKKVAYPLFLDHESGPSRHLFTLSEMCIRFAQLTVEDEERWAEDQNLFAADDDDTALSFSLRNASYDVAEALVENFGRAGLQALWSAMQHIGRDAANKRMSNSEGWWKGIEAVLAIAGVISDRIVDSSYNSIVDIPQLFDLAILPYLDSQSPPYLRGRAFVLASLCAASLPSTFTEQFVWHAMQTLSNDDATIPVKISAVRAFTNFFNKSPETTRKHASQAVLMFAYLLNYVHGHTLVLVLEAIEAAVRAGAAEVDETHVRIVYENALDSWAKNVADPAVTHAVSETLAALSWLHTPAGDACLISSVLPKLAQALGALKGFLPQAAMGLVSSIVDERRAPLGTDFFAQFAEPFFRLLEFTDDQQILQDGLSILTRVVQLDCSQILQWRDSKPGLEHIFNILNRTLDASQTESGGIFVGDLVIQMLRHAGEAVATFLPGLLRALVYRLPTAQTASFIQSLILPFGYLMYSQFDAVATLLEEIDVGGTPAIKILSMAWCENADSIQGYWNRRVSVVGLAQLFVSRRPSLESLPVKGELIVNKANRNVIMTRSRKKHFPDQYTEIVFPAKVLKILIRELVACEEATSDLSVAAIEATNLSDDSADEWEEESVDIRHRVDHEYLKTSSKNSDFEAWDQVDGDDLNNDPINTLDLQAYIIQALQRSIYDDAARMLELSYVLSEKERMILQRNVG